MVAGDDVRRLVLGRERCWDLGTGRKESLWERLIQSAPKHSLGNPRTGVRLSRSQGRVGCSRQAFVQVKGWKPSDDVRGLLVAVDGYWTRLEAVTVRFDPARSGQAKVAVVKQVR